jgi:hypothetical protein
VTWTLSAVDPITGDIPSDPALGLLPPNDETNRGEGFVRYTIRPLLDRTTGTRIDATASIIFDFNETIETPPIFHTLDADAPATNVLALPSISVQSFPVSWVGNDAANGSGVAAYDIYVSTNNGTWQLWLEHTKATSAVYPGAIGNTYAFASVGIDNVGNRESLPSVPDANTKMPLFQVNLPTISEDFITATGVTIASLVNARMRDVDPSALRGIAIAGTTGTGTWQYSLDGRTWVAVGVVSMQSALLLSDNYRLRFVPAANFNGSPGLLAFGWDRTWGGIATRVALPSNLSNTPFTSDAAWIVSPVTPVNDRPVLSATPVPKLRNVAPHPAISQGQTVASLGHTVTDVDGDPLGGIAITAMTGPGLWQYSLDGGANWLTLTLPLTSSALTLSRTDLLRFVPNLGATAGGSISYRAWDRSSGASGQRINVTTSTSASTASLTATVSLNDRPVLQTTLLHLTPYLPGQTATSSLVSDILASNATDIDGNDLGLAITAITGNGQWRYSLDGTTWTTISAVSATSALLLPSNTQLAFQGSVAQTATLSFRVWDRSNNRPPLSRANDLTTSSAYSTATGTLRAAINRAPALATATPTLPTIGEDTTNPAGTLVSALLGTWRSDADGATALSGVAITTTTGTGTWQYSLNGTTWVALGTVSSTQALLLRSTDRVRFVPNANFAGMATLSYHAWDQTFGTVTQRADVSSNGNATAFSSTTLTAMITVLPVNDRPVLNPALSPAWPSALPTTTTTRSVAQILGTAATDVDSSSLGIAIFGRSGAGTWRWSQDGSSWMLLGAVSATSALILDNDDLLQYTGPAGSATLSYRVHDGSNDRSSGALATDLALSSAYSSTTGTMRLWLNNAPTLSTGTPTLTPIAEDATTNAGTLVSQLLTLWRSDVNAGALSGIAITSLGGTNNGTWQYSLNGTTWVAVGTVSETQALLLRSTDRVRFVPSANFNGQVSLTYRAWDQTFGAVAQKVDTSTNGNATAFSSATLTATLTITPVNDRPTPKPGSPLMYLPPMLPNTSNPAGITAGDLVAMGYLDVDDNAMGMAITGLSNVGGVWEHNRGSGWQAVGNVSATSALFLGSTDLLRFRPNAGFNGSSSIRFRVWDQTAGVAGSRASVTATNLTGSLTTTDQTAVVWINNAPVFE